MYRLDLLAHHITFSEVLRDSPMHWAEVDGEQYLSADMSLRCFADRWRTYATIAAVAIAAYPVVGEIIDESAMVKRHSFSGHPGILRATTLEE